ncbi:MAG: hypothetical protein U0547_10520, partial [Dehalococcoidia bacterium]
MSIQPVHVAKSRRGQLGLVLALAAMVAVLASFWTSASATFPSTTVSSVAVTGTPSGGSLLTYTASITLTNGTTTGAVAFRVANPANVTLTDVSAVGAGYTLATCDGAIAGGLTASECVSAAALTGAPAGTTYTFTVQGIVSGPGDPGAITFQWVDSDSTVQSATGGALTRSTAGATPATATNAIGVAETFVFTLAANQTCAGDTSVVGGALPDDATVQCTAADVYNPNGLTIVSGPTVTDPDESDTTQVTVVVAQNTPGVYTIGINGKTNAATTTVPAGTTFTSSLGTKTFVVAELRHVADNATSVVTTGETFGGQDVQNNVRGSRHVVCSVVADTGIVTNTTPVAIDIPLTLPNTQIIVTPGGGYNGAESVTQPQSPTFTDVQIFVGNGRPIGDIVNGVPGNGGLAGATCFSWVSTGAGDQEISVNYVAADGVTSVHVDWDSNSSGNGEGAVRVNRALIKEWNVLEDSTVTLSGGATGSGTGDSTTTPVITGSIGLVLNPGTGLYQTA